MNAVSWKQCHCLWGPFIYQSQQQKGLRCKFKFMWNLKSLKQRKTMSVVLLHDGSRFVDISPIWVSQALLVFLSYCIGSSSTKTINKNSTKTSSSAQFTTKSTRSFSTGKKVVSHPISRRDTSNWLIKFQSCIDPVWVHALIKLKGTCFDLIIVIYI